MIDLSSVAACVRAALLILSTVGLTACTGELGTGTDVDVDDGELDGFRPPGDLPWEQVFVDRFGGSALSGGWVNKGTGTFDACAFVGDGELGVPAKARSVCELYHQQVFGGDGATYFFAARMILPPTHGHHASFWVRHAPGQPYNELDVIESWGADIDRPDEPCSPVATVQTSDPPGWYGVQNVYYANDAPTGIKHCLPRRDVRPLFDGHAHDFAVEWAPGSHVTFYVDGEVSASFGPEAAQPWTLQLSLTNFRTADLSGDGSNKLFVKWVRVWRAAPPAAAPRTQAAPLPEAPADAVKLDDHRVFDPAYYLALYPDLVAAFGPANYEAAHAHWLSYGIAEGRAGSPAFDMSVYRAIYPDLAGHDNAALVDHFLRFGMAEGRVGSVFLDPKDYLSRYADLIEAFGATNYAAAVEHFVTFGIAEGRKGSIWFDAPWYLWNNPDVARAYGATNYLGAMVHYRVYGAAEGRPGAP